MQLNIKKKFGGFHLSIAPKIRLAIGSIVVILLVTAVISIVELDKMSTYVSGAISDDITSITLSTEIAVSVDNYNAAILALVGDADSLITNNINKRDFLSKPAALLERFSSTEGLRADSLICSYEDFVTTSFQLDTVIANDFQDSREWYFTVLVPKYNKFRLCMGEFNGQIHDKLQRNSVAFDQSVYRSLIPGAVSVAVGIVMCLLLQFFILFYYVRPIRRMLGSMESYLRFGQPYSNIFDGDDELQELNADITDLVDENITMKKRLNNNRER